MVKISINRNVNKLEISSYNGYSGETFRYPATFLGFSNELNFFREGNNHSYVGGGITYKRECGNNLVVSPYNINFLRDIENAFIFVENSFVEISPIYNLGEIIDKSKSALSGKVIKYNRPISALKRENLTLQDEDFFKKLMNDFYGINIVDVFSVSSKHGKGSTYFLKSRDREEYVLKYRGRNKKYAELFSSITNSVPNFFPQNHIRKDNGEFTFGVGNDLYGLESFVKGHRKRRTQNYFKFLGVVISNFHSELSRLNQEIRYHSTLKTRYNPFSESRIASVYLDLFLNDLNSHKDLLSNLEDLIRGGLCSEKDNLPECLIHRDLNQSNILWQGNDPKFIDWETMNISKRITEFIPALVLKGNDRRPSYVKKSLTELVNSYNSGGVCFSSNEEKSLIQLLNYSLIGYYVIRSIRRGIKDKTYLADLERDLKQINLET